MVHNSLRHITKLPCFACRQPHCEQGLSARLVEWSSAPSLHREVSAAKAGKPSITTPLFT